MPQLIAILDYKSVRMNLENADKQHASATNMEKLTHEMREIALKTEEETISMRVVTIVTLFFLPGTFASVSLAESIKPIMLVAADVNTDGHVYTYHPVPAGQ